MSLLASAFPPGRGEDSGRVGVDRALAAPRGGALLHLPLRDAAGAVASCAVALRHIAGGSSSACIVRANLPPAVTESACIKLLRRLTHSQTAVPVRELQRDGPLCLSAAIQDLCQCYL